MAFALSYARPDGDTFPMPASAVIVASRQAALWWASSLTLAAWMLAALVVAVGGGWSLLDATPVAFDMPLPVRLTLLAAAPIGAAGATTPLRHALVTIFGYAQAGGMKSVTRTLTAVPPPGATALAWSPAFTGMLIGTAAGVFLMPWHGFAGAAWWRQVATIFLVAGLLALAVVGGFRCARSGATAWREHQARSQLHQHVLTRGTYSPGVVTGVKFTGRWLNSLPVFVVGIDYEVPGGTRSVSSKLVEYPRWAPVPGNQVDVWFDPAAPDDDQRVLLHRRLVGQRFADDPKRFQRPSEGDTAAGPLLPPWVPEDSTAVTSLTTLKHAAMAVLSCAFAVAAMLALPLTAVVVDDLRWWALPAVAAQAVALAGNAGFWVSLVARLRWLVHTSVSIALVGTLAFLGLFPIVLGVLGVEFAWDRQPLDTPLAKLTLVLLIMAAAGGVVAFMTMFSFDDSFRRVVNANRPAPPAEVAEALRCHDPRAIDDLEERYGFRAGIALLR